MTQIWRNQSKRKEKVDGTLRRNVEQTPSSQENGQKEGRYIGYGKKQLLDFLLPIKRILPQNPRILTRKKKQEAPCGNKTNWDDFQQVEGNQKDLLDSDAKGKFSPL